MSRPAECYAQAMLELQYPMDVVEQAQAIWECCPALSEALTNPTISIPEKEAVVRKVFPEAVQDLLCVLCKNAETADVPEIFLHRKDCLLFACHFHGKLFQAFLLGFCKRCDIFHNSVDTAF